MMSGYSQLIEFIRDHYQTADTIPLHAPVFRGNEKQYLANTIDSTFVSSIGAYVDQFETDMAQYTGSPRAIATVNGTAALHVALRLAGVGDGDYVITQPLTFVATCNAIAYCNATPIFVDVDRETMGLSPAALAHWLQNNAYRDDDGQCRENQSQRAIRACLPMHTFGHPADVDGLVKVCRQWGLTLVEDAAESLGSTWRGQHIGTFGEFGTLSFNGNKVLTTGGGGMILTDQAHGDRAKHLTTTAKQPHTYEYIHNELGYNYRMPNLNAALGCAQLEQLDAFIEEKRNLAKAYADLLKNSDLTFVREPEHARSNYWLNAVCCENQTQRDALIQQTNDQGVMTRPIWRLMTDTPMYADAPAGDLPNACWLEERVVNLPSGIRANEQQ